MKYVQHLILNYKKNNIFDLEVFFTKICQTLAYTLNFTYQSDPVQLHCEPLELGSGKFLDYYRYRYVFFSSLSRSSSGPILIPAQQQIILLPTKPLPIQKIQTVVRYQSNYFYFE